MKFIVSRIEDWDMVAKELVTRLKPGIIIALSGPLGAGKTTFVQSLAKVLGVKDVPRSPTFSLLRTYRLPEEVHGIERLVHVDAYRLEESSDAHALGLDEELAAGDAAIVIEWPEKLGSLLAKLPMVRVQIETDASGVRRVSIV